MKNKKVKSKKKQAGMRFENLSVWQKSKELTVSIYKLFRNNNDFGFRDQIQRASVSVMNNIAEGYERKHDSKEFARFLYISKASCGEVRSMLALALELGYIPKKEYEQLNPLAIEISKMIFGLIKSL